MINTPFNYTGSKFKLLEQILPHFDYTKEYFIDLFCGGGSVYTNVVDKYQKVLINDIIKDLIGIHQELIQSDDIVERTKSLCVTLKENQGDYIRLREDYNLNPSPDKLWALMLSCNSNLLRFNQKGVFNQTWGKRSWNSSTEQKVKSFTEHIRKYKNKIEFSSCSFDLIEITEKSFYYIDPPYGFVTDKNGEIGNKQISEAGYNNFYTVQNDVNLLNFCHKVNDSGSTFVISGVFEHGGQTSWLLDKLIKDGFTYYDLIFDYEKVNKSKSNKKTREIIIKNF